jgi:hypothetical protein
VLLQVPRQALEGSSLLRRGRRLYSWSGMLRRRPSNGGRPTDDQRSGKGLKCGQRIVQSSCFPGGSLASCCLEVIDLIGSSGRTRTYNPSVNSCGGQL